MALLIFLTYNKYHDNSGTANECGHDNRAVKIWYRDSHNWSFTMIIPCLCTLVFKCLGVLLYVNTINQYHDITNCYHHSSYNNIFVSATCNVKVMSLNPSNHIYTKTYEWNNQSFTRTSGAGPLSSKLCTVKRSLSKTDTGLCSDASKHLLWKKIHINEMSWQIPGKFYKSSSCECPEAAVTKRTLKCMLVYMI